MIELYEAVEAVLGDKYTVGYQHMEENLTDVIGVYLYESSNDVKYTSGEYMYESIKVHVQLNSDKSMEGIDSAIKFLRNFVDKMEYDNNDTAYIEFIDCEHIGPKAVNIGKNSYGIPVCKSVIDIKYNIKER